MGQLFHEVPSHIYPDLVKTNRARYSIGIAGVVVMEYNEDGSYGGDPFTDDVDQLQALVYSLLLRNEELATQVYAARCQIKDLSFKLRKLSSKKNRKK